MFFLEVAMCEKCRSSHFQLEGGVKSWGGVKKFRDWGSYQFGGGCYFHWGEVSTPLHVMTKKSSDIFMGLGF